MARVSVSGAQRRLPQLVRQLERGRGSEVPSRVPRSEGHASPRGAASAADGAATRVALWTTRDVVSETVTLLRHRVGHDSALTVLADLYPRLRLVEYGAELHARALELFRRYGRDHQLSLCDAISFVVATTLLDRIRCLACDEDFRRLGLTVIAPSY